MSDTEKVFGITRGYGILNNTFVNGEKNFL